MQFLCAVLFALMSPVVSLKLRMSIVVFGGTGKTGSEVVLQALKGGKQVVVLARDPSKMVYPKGSGADKADQPFNHPNLKLIQGSVTNEADVKKTFAAAESIEGVVISLGGKTKDVGPSMLTDGSRNVINAMKEKGVKRVSVVTSIGAGDSESQAPLMFKALMYTVMKGIFVDKNNQEALFVKPDGPGHDLEW
jgi:nucleoside-diphosphate-sugar epimerase